MPSAPARRPEDPTPSRFAEVVPGRAVLTELARGFLLVHDADPERAKRFAQTFLREATGPKPPPPPLPPGRLAIVRRGLEGSLREPR